MLLRPSWSAGTEEPGDDDDAADEDAAEEEAEDEAEDAAGLPLAVSSEVSDGGGGFVL